MVEATEGGRKASGLLDPSKKIGRFEKIPPG